MLPGKTAFSRKYVRLFAEDELEDDDRDAVSDTSDGFGGCRRRKQCRWWTVVVLSLGGLLAGVMAFLSLVSALDSTCQNPVVRKEWRDLSRDEKTEYIRATQCLQHKPSRLGLDHSLYLDFPYVHIHVGNRSHHTGEFLAWHRYLLYAYESALRDVCGLKGHLPYWDWSIDWKNITLAPVFHDEDGFGGDGNKSDSSPSIHGFCVTSGPFARLEVPFIEQFSYSHCLSRDISHDDSLNLLKPSSLEALLRMEDEVDFTLALEEGAHLSIPRTINGDFSTITAPADPLFYLHHGQLDRLWWLWQQRHHAVRTEGIHRDSLLQMGGLAPDIPARNIINTETELLCYRY